MRVGRRRRARWITRKKKALWDWLNVHGPRERKTRGAVEWKLGRAFKRWWFGENPTLRRQAYTVSKAGKRKRRSR